LSNRPHHLPLLSWVILDIIRQHRLLSQPGEDLALLLDVFEHGISPFPLLDFLLFFSSNYLKD